MNVPSKPLDDAIAERLVTAVTPLTIELALEALTSLEERDKATAAQWRRRIERARYDADLAERRYEAVDPANRLIASTLEQRWNDAMQRLLELEAELANFERQTLRTITAEQKRQILKLARDFPRLWTASTTAARDRKRMLRLLIRDITVVKGPEPKRRRLHIRWQGGTPKRSNSTCRRTAPKRFVITMRLLLESVPLQSCTMTMRSSRCSTATASQAQLANPSRSA